LRDDGRHGLGRLGRGPRRCLRRPDGQEAQRVDVALVIARDANAEVDEGLGDIHDAARADRADDRSFRDEGTALDADRPEVDECRGVSKLRLNRHGLATVRDGSSERDHAVDRGDDIRSSGRADVDAAVLPGGVRMGAVKGERAQDRPVDRPRPRLRGRDGQCKRAQDEHSGSPEHKASLLPDLRTLGP
jgi:hypothetical protein